jgi:hypothetical protein
MILFDQIGDNFLVELELILETLDFLSLDFNEVLTFCFLVAGDAVILRERDGLVVGTGDGFVVANADFLQLPLQLLDYALVVLLDCFQALLLALSEQELTGILPTVVRLWKFRVSLNDAAHLFYLSQPRAFSE